MSELEKPTEVIEESITTTEVIQSLDDESSGEEVTTEYSDVQVAAMKKGWNPDKEDVPEGREWIEAGEFMRNESFFSEIRKLKRANKSMEKNFDVLKEHHRKVEEHTRDKLLTELKQQKRVALEEDDHAAVVEIDEQMLDIKTKSSEKDAVDMQAEDNTIFDGWADENPWYDSNEEMREAADEIGNGYYTRMGGKVTPQQVYNHVTKQVKRMFPEEFGAAPASKRAKVVAVEAGARGSRATKSKSKFTKKDLNSEQLAVMRRFVKTGALKEQEYIDELVKIGEVG